MIRVRRFLPVPVLSLSTLFVACVAMAPAYLLAQDLDPEDPDAGEAAEGTEEIQEPQVITYIPFEGNHHAFHRGFRDEDGTRVFGDPLARTYVRGIAGQASDLYAAGVHLVDFLDQGAVLVYPADQTIRFSEGSLLLWVRWAEGWADAFRGWAPDAPRPPGAPPRIVLTDLVDPVHVESWFLRRVRGDGRWHHIALTWSRPENRVVAFLDAEPVGQLRLTDLPVHEAGAPCLLRADLSASSRAHLTLGGFFPGAMDEVVIWDKPVEPEEIRSAYRRGREGQPPCPDEVLPRRDTPERLARLAARAPSGRPPLPPEARWDLKAIPTEPAPGIVRYALHGLWRVQPTGPVGVPPTSIQSNRAFAAKRQSLSRYEILADPWLHVSFPGPWKPPAESTPTPPEPFLGVPIDAWTSAWAERDFPTPPEWDGKRVTLEIERVGTGDQRDYLLFLNGGPLGRTGAFDRGRFDITPLLKPGTTSRIRLFLPEGSLEGDAWITVHPDPQVGIEEVFVSPRTEDRKLAVRFRAVNRSGRSRDTQVRAHLRRWHYNDQAQERPPVPLRLSADETQVHTVEFPGDGLTPWTPEDTTLYEVALSLLDTDGRLLDSSVPVRFGYRSIRVDRDRASVLLNGQPLHFRGTSHNALQGGRIGPGYEIWFRQIGANAFRTLTPDLNFPNVAPSLRACDEVGLFCHYNVKKPHWGQLGSPLPFLRDYYARRRDHLHHFPSFAVWQPWMTGFFPAPWGHPMLIGAVPGRDFDPANPDYAPHQKAMSVIAEIDPEHPLYFYRAGIGGQIRAHMHYQGPGNTLQGKEEWPRIWYENRQAIGEPFCGSEVDLYVFMWDTLWQIGLQTFKPHSRSAYDPAGYGAWNLGEEAYAGITPRHIAVMELTHHLPELEKLAQGLPKGTGPRVDDAVPAGGTGRVDGVADTQLEDALLKERPAERPEGAPSPAPAPTQRSAYEALLQENMSLMLHHSVAPRYRARWYQQVIRSWRTYGIGFMVHCDFSSEYLVTDGRLNAAGVAVARNNAPVLVYIADGPDEFVRKDHAAFAGESIVKQIVICNDRFQPMRVKSEWQMTDRGQPESVLASGMDEVDVPPGEIRFRRIETQAPPAPARRPLLLRLAATVNGERQIRPPKAIHPYQRETTNLLPPELSYGDEFAIEVFPKPGTPRIAGPVHLLDTTGDTRTMLAKTGTTVSDLAPDAPVPGKGLVLIGRNSLSGPVLDWFVRPETASALAAGLNVVVFEQRSRWLTGLRMKHLDERQVFIADPSHPLVTGLRDEDFAHWRGASDIIPAYPVPPAIAAYRGSPAPPVPPPPDEPDEQDTLLARAPDTSDDLGDEHVAAHWSNHNMVATYSFIKPQCPGFRCILQDGFDLLYSPLVERRIGQGRILYCALDVTNRYGFDPMATILVHRILEEYSRSVPRAERRLVSLGPGRGQAFLEKAGRVAEALRDPDGLGAADLLVLHGDDREDFQRLSKAAPQIRQAIQSGASVLLVRVGKDSPLDFLPFDMRREEAEVYETEFPREWSLLSGLSASDFFWRRTVPIVRVSTPAPGARNLPSGLIAQIPCGKGQVVFFQADDEMFRKPYDLVEPDRKSSQILRRWVRVKVYRILNSLLDEMGAAAPRPARLDGNTYESRVGAYVERGEPFHPMAHRGW